jgi:hypothetical protein
MNLLLLEDRKEGRVLLEKLIGDITSGVAITAATSIRDLAARLTTGMFDAAILDVDLREWYPDSFTTPIYANDKHLKNGLDVAQIIKMCNARLDDSCILMYSGGDVPDAKVKVLKKGYGDIEVDLRNELGNILAKPEYYRPLPDVEEFRTYNLMQKTWYYKEIFSRTNVAPRFNLLGQHAWISDFNTRDERSCVGPMLADTKGNQHFFMKTMVEVCEYRELPDLVKSGDKIPHVFWNYHYESYFERQFDEFRLVREKSEELDLSFDICYSSSMASHLLDLKKKQAGVDKCLGLLAHNGGEIIVGTQQYLVQKMAAEGAGDTEIRETISMVSRATRHEILQLYECTVLEVDPEAKTVFVSMKSLLEHGNHLTRDFSHSRLEEIGVGFQDSQFLYRVTEDKKDLRITSIIEPL